VLNIRSSLLGLFVLVGTLLPAKESFVIDSSKPYAYVEFDHIGRRTPARDKEVAEGIWLRLVNNSPAPIKVRVFDLGAGEPGVGMNYDVVRSRSLVVKPKSSEREHQGHSRWVFL
jgi:hypothetical protein